MSKIKNLILDAGGVLAHPLHGNWAIPAKYREILGDYAADIPGEKWLTAIQTHADILREDVYVKDLSAEYALKLQYMRNVCADMGWQLRGADIIALAHDFTYNNDRYAWYKDSKPWLKIWRTRYNLGVLSDALPSFRAAMEEIDWRQYLHALVISAEVGAAKPDARMYNTICAQLNAAPEESLFVDDKVCNLLGAMRCGIHVVQMCRDSLPHWNGPYVRDLDELNAYMEALN